MARPRSRSPALPWTRNAQDGPDVGRHPTLLPSRKIWTARHKWMGQPTCSLSPLQAVKARKINALARRARGKRRPDGRGAGVSVSGQAADP
jgi:hypothetical protein